MEAPVITAPELSVTVPTTVESPVVCANPAETSTDRIRMSLNILHHPSPELCFNCLRVLIEVEHMLNLCSASSGLVRPYISCRSNECASERAARHGPGRQAMARRLS